MSRPATLFALILSIGITTAPGAKPGPGPDAGRTPPTAEERRKVRIQEHFPRSAERAKSLQEAMLAPAGPVDVERYTLDLKVIPAISHVEGTIGIQARVQTAGLTLLDVDLYDSLTVSSVLRGAMPLAFTRSGNRLHVSLDRPYAVGELVDLQIAYAGTPPAAGYGAFTFRTHGVPAQPIVSSLSEDVYAPAWWPCIDNPVDKAIVDMNINVPGDLTAVSNGLLVATIVNPDGTKTFQWRSAYPISTYLVSVAISNYATFTATYNPVTGGPPMLVQHWVYPEHLAAAQVDLSVTVPQLTFFSGLFGEYPFVLEKYGHAIFPWGGGMEHQTVSSYGAGLIRGDHRYDWIVAHELAHQWWGDSVTLSNWKETWLNEGFASYSEGLWWENLNGAAGLRSYMVGFDSRPFCGTLADPGTCDNFGHTVYDKGAWVLHMLRHVVGDASFFQGLRHYASDFQYSSATTPDFKAVMEAASGRALTSFFDRWAYQQGEPSYKWGWSAASTPAGWVTYVRIEQIQPGGLFEMPIDVRINTTSGSLTATVDNDAVIQDFVLPAVSNPPTSVEFDPGYWILKTTTTMTLPDDDTDGVPDAQDNCAQSSNPEQTNLDGDSLGDVCDQDIDGDGRENGSDCAPFNPAILDPPTEVSGLEAEGGPELTLFWEADPAQGAGLVYDLLRGDVAALLADGGVASAGCLLTDLALPQAVDPAIPSADQSFYYLVRKRSDCGSGPLGNDSSGQPRQSANCP